MHFGVFTNRTLMSAPRRLAGLWRNLSAALAMLALILGGLPTVASAQPGIVGEVVMAMGDVVRSAGDARGPLKQGDQIHEGDQLQSGADGYVYLRAVDGSFISLRPNARMRFEVYRFDAANPAASRFRVVLEKGVMRSISGPGVKAARERYRLNTPVAAIGLRGTDFSVYADAEITRVTVREGGVVMTPLGESCAAAGFGPCEGVAARDLRADRSDFLLQLRRGDAAPALLDLKLHPQAPDKVAPPLPGEGASAGSGTGSSAPRSDSKAGLDVAPALVVEQESRILEKIVVSTGADTSPTVPGSGRVDLPPPSGGSVPPAIEWGRWREIAGMPAQTTLQALREGGRSIEAVNTYFALSRDTSLLGTLPRSGVFSFNLTAHEGYLVNTQTLNASPAVASNAVLTIDFDRRAFATSLQLSSGDLTSRLNAEGKLYATGDFSSNVIYSNGSVRGVVGGAQGSEAGYLYQTNVDASRQFLGATFWRR